MLKVIVIKNSKICLNISFNEDKYNLVDNKKLSRLIVRLNKAFETYLLGQNIFCKAVKDLNLDANLNFCSKYKIKKLNHKHRNKNKITDVLSFPLNEDLRNKSNVIYQPTIYLGDIFICTDRAYHQAKEFDITLEDEIIHLINHGFLHLLGLDHEISAKEEKIMQKIENKIIVSL